MPTTLSAADIATSLREAYDDKDNSDLFVKEHPLQGLIAEEMLTDKQLRVPIMQTTSQGASPVFATAQTNAVAGTAAAFVASTVNLYQTHLIEGELVEKAAIGNASKFLKEICDGVDSTIGQLGNRMALAGYRSSGGSIGVTSAGTASPITFLYPESVDSLEIGMTISANNTNDATSPRSGTGVITEINSDTGVVTYTGTITSLGVGDFIFVSSTEGASATGLNGYVPETAYTSGQTLWGVDMTKSKWTAGTRLDASAMGPEETFSRANARAQRTGIKPDVWLLHPSDLSTLEISTSQAKQVVDSQHYQFGYDCFTGPGNTKVVTDADCPRGELWGVPLKHFKKISIGKAPKIIDADGLLKQRMATADSYEARFVARYNFVSDCPSALVRVKLAV